MQNPMTHMSRRQRQIMDILFRHRAATAEEIRERLPDPPSNSAVRAMLATMVNKGYVSQKEENFRYVYSAAIKQEVAQKSAIDRLVNTFFGGSTAATVSALLGMKSEQISLDELNELSEIIEKAKKK
ncbi:MAG TPA: BlaI/MecI/CopY family transcriptional regulator [Gammaproteobacteria bacterium]